MQKKRERRFGRPETRFAETTGWGPARPPARWDKLWLVRETRSGSFQAARSTLTTPGTCAWARKQRKPGAPFMLPTGAPMHSTHGLHPPSAVSATPATRYSGAMNSSIIAVTGATRQLGGLVIDHLLKSVPASSVVAIADALAIRTAWRMRRRNGDWWVSRRHCRWSWGRSALPPIASIRVPSTDRAFRAFSRVAPKFPAGLPRRRSIWRWPISPSKSSSTPRRYRRAGRLPGGSARSHHFRPNVPH